MGLDFGMWGGSFLGMILFGIVCITIAIWILGIVFNSSNQTNPQLERRLKQKRSPLKRLEQRYAQGEISREDYHGILNDVYNQKEIDNVY